MNFNHQRLTFTGRVNSFRFALKGIWFVLRTQHNAWLHAVATLIVVGAGVWIHLSRGDWCWVVLAITVVWAAEAFNTAVELLVDLASPAIHPVAGKAKDVAAGAVLITSIGAAVIGVLVIGPRLMNALHLR